MVSRGYRFRASRGCSGLLLGSTDDFLNSGQELVSCGTRWIGDHAHDASLDVPEDPLANGIGKLVELGETVLPLPELEPQGRPNEPLGALNFHHQDPLFAQA